MRERNDLLWAEIMMLKKRLINVSKRVNRLSHPYLVNLSRRLDEKMNALTRIKSI